jgi:NAD(P)-dependent dehydrogenase (short-subunit alcohol dehydrogenase family)
VSTRPETAVVVGATGAMGQVIVRALADKGLRVVAVARSSASVAALARESASIVPCACDIASDAAEEAIRAAVDGTVRMVVHGPGVTTAGGVLTAPTAAVVEAVNIKCAGLMRLVRAVDARLVRGSRIVAIGGHYGFEPTAYAATAGVGNAALANLVRQMSWAYGDRGITAHLIAPGPADTDRLRRVATSRAEREHSDADAVLRDMLKESAIGAFTTVEQIAWAVTMLLAPEADALAGSPLFMDAGRRRAIP